MWKSWNCSSRSWVFRSIARFHERSRKRERKGAGNEGILANLEKGKKRKGTFRRVVSWTFPVRARSREWNSFSVRGVTSLERHCTAISCIVHGQLERNKGGTSRQTVFRSSREREFDGVEIIGRGVRINRRTFRFCSSLTPDRKYNNGVSNGQ